MISRSLKHHRPAVVARYRVCLELLGNIKGKKVIDLGCGDGALSGLLAKKGAEVTGVDTNEVGLILKSEI